MEVVAPADPVAVHGVRGAVAGVPKYRVRALSATVIASRREKSAHSTDKTRWHCEWIARQLTEACGWSEPPHYIIRDRDSAYGDAFIRRLTAMGIRDRPI